MTVNIALIGAGRIGKVHAKAIATAIPQAKIVAVADYFAAAAFVGEGRPPARVHRKSSAY